MKAHQAAGNFAASANWGTESERIPVYDSAGIKSQALFELKELFRYRFLIRNLVSRDLKVRYKRSVLGFIWVMLNPLLTMGVITIVFTQLFSRFQVQHYPAFLLCGILVWNLFAQGSVAAMSNLVGNSGVLRRMYVPPSVFVASSVGSALVNLAFAIVPFFILAILTSVAISPMWLFVIVPCVEATVFTFGVGLIVSALMVFFQDTFEIYTVLLNALIYLTPVYYPLTILPPQFQAVMRFNPMFLFMDEVRKAVLEGQRPAFHEMWIPAAMALGMFAIGWLFFTRLERGFANHL